MFRARSTSKPETRSRLRLAIRSTKIAPQLDGVERAGVHSPVLVDHEVGVGGLEQGVVLRGLDVPLPGVQDLPSRQGLVDGIGRGDEPPTGRHRRRRSSCSDVVMMPLLKSGPPPSWRR